MAEYLRMSGIYWCLAALDILDEIEEADKNFIINYIKINSQDDGGYAAAQGHGMLISSVKLILIYTIQIHTYCIHLVLYNSLLCSINLI